MRINKIKNNKYTIWKIIYLLAIGLILALAIYFIFFIYQNIFNTLSNAYAIGILKTGTSIDIIDDKAYDKARDMIKLKNNLTTVPANIKNIFINPTQQNVISTSTKTKK